MPRSNATQCLRLLVFIAVALLSSAYFAPPALAQPAGNEMCGDGTTFTVHLPGRSLGIDNSDGFFRDVIVPNPGPADSITLPNGCRLYVLLVTGYRQNEFLDKIIFYQVAEFAAKNNGYVHVAWWNNLLKEYMAAPLHRANVTIERFFPLLFPDVVIPPNPGGYDFIRGNVGLFLPGNFLDFPKANPASDDQFRSDAALMIQAIKLHNPNALIVVAGHSMGGDSAARLGRNPALPIDLLALIDPANNQDLPRGLVGQSNFNWTRWRAAHDFRGFQQWDCERNNLGLCLDNDPRLFVFQPRCFVAQTIHVKPPLPSLAPVHCPALLPIADPGTRRGFGANVKHLYHRWQTESLPPSDFLQAERFDFPAPLATSILGPNYQEPFLENFGLEGDPNKTCANELSPDPRRNNVFKTCVRWDGHGEIVGYRGIGVLPLPGGLDHPGLGMRQWPSRDPLALNDTNSPLRRDKIIELATADATWPHRPEDPNTCMVCDDIISIIVHLLAQQTPPPPADVTAPFTVATAAPGPNANGWNNGDVTIMLHATDNTDGAGVKEIEHSTSGASPAGTVVTQGSSAQETVTAEGTTTLAFFARDNAGNAEATKTRETKLDKTPPDIASVTDVQPNANGWIRTDVLVSFPASDALSGLASSSPDVLVSTEGAAQGITGTAEDNAGNQATAIVTLNIDKTPPTITLATRTPAANAAGWDNTDVTFTWNCTDALSGVALPSVTQSLTSEGAAQMVIGTCTDLAGNSASDTQAGINIDKTPPEVFATATEETKTGWFTADVEIRFSGTDALSGIDTCSAPVMLTGEGASLQASGSCSDRAGNSATVSRVVMIDRMPPTLTFLGQNPPANAAGWSHSDVTLTWSCTDALSGVAAFEGDEETPGDGNTNTRTLTNEGMGQSATMVCTDRAGNSVSDTQAAINIDKTPPEVSTVTEEPNANNWFNVDVEVIFRGTDALSGIDSCSAPVLLTGEGASLEASGSCSDRAGNSATASRIVMIDRTPPALTFLGQNPPANAAGWNNSDVTLTWNCTDALSGVPSQGSKPTAGAPDVTRLMTSEGMGQPVTAACTDRAGNTGSDTQAVNLDKTPPVVTPGRTPPNANGWNNGDVTVSFSGSDALSGIAGCSEPVLLAAEGTGQSASGNCSDVAGNSASATIAGINIDRTAPTAAGTPDRAPDSNDWYNHVLTVTWSGADALSGIASCSAASPYAGPDSASASVNGACADQAGNSTGAIVSFKFDATKPVINIATPSSGAVYLLNAAVNADYGCTDTASGVQSCSGTVASGAAFNTASVGSKQFTVTSGDVAGNTASVTHNYSVLYGFSGFANPIGPLPMANVVNAGRTVPVKYYLQNAGGAFISDLASFVSLMSAPVACDASAPGVLAEETDAAGSTTIHYDAISNQFIYNWKTDKSWAGSCRALQLTLNDGTQHWALFQFK